MSEHHDVPERSGMHADRAPDSQIESRTPEFFYTPIEERFERISRLATRALDVPIAAITLLHPEKQWFKSVVGWDVSELPLHESLCAQVAKEGRLCIVPDAKKDRRFANHSPVVSHPHIRFFASYPLFDKALNLSGTFCVFDTVPRELTDSDCQSLADLGQLAQRELSAGTLAEMHSEIVTKLATERRESMLDPLTRVWNRQGAETLLESFYAKACEEGQSIGICVLELDVFKRVNDLDGGDIADQVLRNVAAILVGCLRPGDVVCRFGGDQFLIILPGSEDIQASTIAERARRSVADLPIPTRQGAVPISANVGYKVLKRADQLTLESIVADAENAFVAHENEERDQIRFAG